MINPGGVRASGDADEQVLVIISCVVAREMLPVGWHGHENA
jgi:hypothetical protein